MGTLRKVSANHDKQPGALLMDVDMDDLGKRSSGLLVDPYLFRRHHTNGESKKLELPRGKPRLDEYDLGYLLTAHKSQGSSWDDVTVIDDSASFRDNRNKWMYTSLTRAERGLTLLLRV